MISKLLIALMLCDAGDYTAAMPVLKKCEPSVTRDFYIAVCGYKLNDRATVLKYAPYVYDAIQPVQRYSHVAQLMYDEAEQWRTGDLADVGRDMGMAADRIDSYRPDNDLQKQIIDKLDRLIKEQETPPQSLASQSPSDQSTPMPESQGGQADAGKGDVGAEIVRRYPNWGSMPAKERARVIQELDLRLPPKWKDMYDDYQKGLTRGR